MLNPDVGGFTMNLAFVKRIEEVDSYELSCKYYSKFLAYSEASLIEGLFSIK